MLQLVAGRKHWMGSLQDSSRLDTNRHPFGIAACINRLEVEKNKREEEREKRQRDGGIHKK